MRLRCIMLIGTNLVLLTAFWPLTDELLSLDTSDPTTYKPVSISLPTSSFLPEQPELARPLFRTRPTPSEHDVLPSSISSSLNMRLLGIVLTDERRVAVLEHNGLTLRVKEGDDVDGWQVTKIERRKIQFENSEQYIDVPLDLPVSPP